jgi:hypothetical protein
LEEDAMRLDLDRVRANVRAATTEDLLDRVTVYRAGMEDEALDLIERELRDRNVTRDDIAAHERRRRETMLLDSAGIARKCHQCQRPAVVETWGWHRVWGLLPLFRRRFAWCEEHRPDSV